MQLPAITQPPKTRAACIDGPRPCPWSRCRHHIQGGACVLDIVAAHGPMRLEAIADTLGVTRQAVQQMETRALERLRQSTDALTAAHETGVFARKGARALPPDPDTDPDTMSDRELVRRVDDYYQKHVRIKRKRVSVIFGALTRARPFLARPDCLHSPKTGRRLRIAPAPAKKSNISHAALVITEALIAHQMTRHDLESQLAARFHLSGYKAHHITSRIYAGYGNPTWTRRALEILGIPPE